MSTLERAIEIATEAHAGQADKAGERYILHPLRVMAAMDSDSTRIAAVLHDVVEDTDWSLERLATEGFSPDIVRAIDALTRRDGEDYFEFVRRAKADPIASLVKVADVRDNMDMTRLRVISDRDRDRLKRYEEAMRILQD